MRGQEKVRERNLSGVSFEIKVSMTEGHEHTDGRLVARVWDRLLEHVANKGHPS